VESAEGARKKGIVEKNAPKEKGCYALIVERRDTAKKLV
jgi:hypothetical protein